MINLFAFAFCGAVGTVALCKGERGIGGVNLFLALINLGLFLQEIAT